MIKIENTETYGWEAAIWGMRNPYESWNKSDSYYCTDCGCENCRYDIEGDEKNCLADYSIGPNDHDLMMKLVTAGPAHSKFMRMITVTADITLPLYWWKEMDTYKVGTVANSCSTMHKIHAKEFTLEDFSCEHLDQDNYILLKEIIARLNRYRNIFISGGIVEYPDGGRKVFKSKDKDILWKMIQLLPSSYNQRRTIQLNYQVLRNIYHARRNHKLDRWREFSRWIENLPYSELITGGYRNG